MRLEIYGEPGNYSAHGEYEPGVDPALLSCPFCQGNRILVENTHTPSYSAECRICGAIGPSGLPTGHREEWEQPATAEEAKRVHHEAFATAIERWNTRFGQRA